MVNSSSLNVCGIIPAYLRYINFACDRASKAGLSRHLPGIGAVRLENSYCQEHSDEAISPMLSSEIASLLLQL